MEGSSTGSALNNQVITPNLSSTIRIASTYGSEAGTGGNITYYTASIPVTAGNQNYNLNTWASASASLQPGDSIEVKTVFQQTPPAIVRYFDPYAGTGTGIQSLLESFNFGSYSPGINFMLMPLNFDILKLQAIELNDQVRKSGKHIPRLFLSGPHLDGSPPAYPNDAYVVRDEAEAIRQVNEVADQGSTVIKIYFRTPPGLIKAITDAAHKRGIPVTGHLEITEAKHAIEARYFSMIQNPSHE